MNQILASKKIYVTPDMKKKKKFFKIEFFLSVFLLCILSVYCVYAEYDRKKSEEVSQEILGEMNLQDNTVIEEVVVVVLNAALDETEEVDLDELINTEEVEVPQEQMVVANDGTEYYTIGQINIPSINVNYPILASKTENFDTLLKIAPCKFHGANPNEVGNLCIVGHNYRNSKFFSKVPTLGIGDTIDITDLSNRTFTYSIYDKYTVSPEDTQCTSQLTKGKTEITLITCTNDSKQRVIVKAMKI